MIPKNISLSWKVAYRLPGNNKPEKWTDARVPGAVQLDVARAEGYGPHEYGENWKDYLWMEDSLFTYRTVFHGPDLAPGERLLFICGGIDYAFDIHLNEGHLLSQEGMFTPVRLDLTEALLEENVLEITIHPIPKKYTEPVDRTQVTESVKPAVSYGWDWHPRLVPSGIWDEARLEVLPASRVEDLHLAYVLSEDFSRVDARLEIQGEALESCMLNWVLKDPAGKELYRARVEDGHSFSVDNPRLWWPHDHGDPALCAWRLEVSSREGDLLQVLDGRCGFRRVKLLMNEGGWDDQGIFPKTRSVVPIQMEVNGRRIFCKGSNWVNPEIFPGIITEERYASLLQMAKDANFNLLRVWGGGIVNKESFHRLCDELGLLVWQEFPLACNNHEDLPGYLKVLRQEADSIIGRIRKHPSLAIWSGGNELFNSWSGMGDQSLALRMLNSRCLEMDPLTPFIATSPLYGMGHGHYVFRDQESEEEVYACMNRSQCTAYPEFGVPSPADSDILRSIIPPEELWPPAPGTAWESHHAFNAWEGDTWLMQDVIEYYFGPSPDLESLVERGQILQGEGYKAIYEEARRQKPYCSMALNWCFNEAWPAAANNSLISYPDRKKPAFHEVARACRPILASARNYTFAYSPGESFRAELWMLNDSRTELPAGRIKARILSGEKEIYLGGWDYDRVAANENLRGPKLNCVLDKLEAGLFTLVLEVEGHQEYNSAYKFLLK